jgi:hypothetical protein
MAFPIEKDSDVVLMLHLRPSGRPETVQASIGLYLSDTPPMRVPALLRLTRQDLHIPPGATRHVVTDSYTLPVGVDVYTVQPHAHNLARQIESVATLPDGTTKPLLLIKNWEFNWQGVYQYSTPVFLPAGSTVAMRWTYDNSTGNVLNPNRPPRRVTFGQRTSDEMSELWFQVVPRNQSDRATLVRGMRSHVQPENIKGYETMLGSDADNAALHDDVALLYVEAGNLERAATHFAESVRIKPDSAAAHYNLGTALLALGHRDEARLDFWKALDLDPGLATRIAASASSHRRRERSTKPHSTIVTRFRAPRTTRLPTTIWACSCRYRDAMTKPSGTIATRSASMASTWTRCSIWLGCWQPRPFPPDVSPRKPCGWPVSRCA